MIKALEALLKDVHKKDGGKAFVSLNDGARVRQAGQYWLYRFVVPKGTSIPSNDTPVKVGVGGLVPVAGFVVSHHGGAVIVGLEKDHGPVIDAATLVVDLTWLLERLRNRLDDVLHGAVPFNRASAERVFHPARAEVADAQPFPAVEQGPRTMNEDQLQAVRRSLGSDTTFIWGPPGTGKTWTLARVVEAHYRAGRSVLLVSNTNVAVDAALEQVAERLRDEPGFARGLVMRHGPVVSDSLRHRFGAQVTPEEVAARLRREKWRREAQRPRQEAEAARAALKRLEANWVTWIISTYDRWRLQERIAGAERSAENADRVARASAGSVGALESEIADLLARCRILATTIHRTYGYGGGAPRHFDTVVVDEASMLMPPHVYWAAGLATRSVTVAGDFRQLPPVVESESPLAGTLKRDVFEVAGIPDRLKRPEPIPYLVSLRTQYRMRPAICEIVNRHFYPDLPLRSHHGVQRVDTGFPFSKAALLYVDTARFHPWASWTKSGSHYNPFHALLVRNVVWRLVKTGFLPPAEEEVNEAVGVVSPYRAQARCIETLLLGACGRGIASTIHSFQGRERQALVIDLTDSDGIRLGGFLQATRIDEVGARMLNVAVSRAKHHLMLVGNFRYLRKKAPPGGFVPRLLDHFERYGTRLMLDGDGGSHGGEGLNRSDDDVTIGRASNNPRVVRVAGLVPSDHEWLKRPCPKSSCDGRLAVRHGPKGPFLACTDFLEPPKCSHTEGLAPSATVFGVTGH